MKLLYVLAIVALAALMAPWLTPYDPTALKVLDRLQSPRAAHWFGTDELGRDVFSRVVFGARYSLMIGAFVVAISVTCGVTLGLAAGYFRHLDGPIMRLVDAMMSFPDILLAIALVAVLGASMTNVILALAVVYTPRVARVVRASTLVVRELLFIEAGRLAWPRGASCSSTSCPTSRHLSSYRRPSSSPMQCSPRPACRSSASASLPPCRPGAR